MRKIKGLIAYIRISAGKEKSCNQTESLHTQHPFVSCLSFSGFSHSPIWISSLCVFSSAADSHYRLLPGGGESQHTERTKYTSSFFPSCKGKKRIDDWVCSAADRRMKTGQNGATAMWSSFEKRERGYIAYAQEPLSKHWHCYCVYRPHRGV